jgi:magnesium transporter
MRADLGLAARFAADHPEEAAAALEQLSFADAAALLADLDPPDAAQLVARISAALAVDCLKTMPDRLVGSLLGELPLDLAAHILVRAAEETRRLWLAELPPERAEFLRRKLRYPPGTAGALVDPLVLALPEDLSVAEAQKHLRRSADRAYFYVYVVDREQRLVGALDLRELLQADPKEALAAVMHRDVERVPAHADLAAVAGHASWHDVDALPVVDAAGVFFGIIRHRTMRQISAAGAGQEARPVMQTLVSLGELYWAGLSAFLMGVSAVGPSATRAPAPVRVPTPPGEEVTDGA